MPPRRVIGIDAGGTKLLGGVVDEALVVHHRVRRTWRGADRQETLDIFTGAVEEVRAVAPDVESVGFGIPSLVDWQTGVSTWSNHLPLGDVPFRDLMSERLGLPVVVDNDGNASVLAEARAGAAQGSEHVVMVSLGTGIGTGLYLNGGVYRGASGLGSELGHTVLELDGADCPGACPGRGCFETLVSGMAIGREGERLARELPDSELGRRLAEGVEISGGLVTELAHGGDPASRSALENIGRKLGYGLVGVVNLFNPQVIVIGGGAVRAGDLLLEPARAVVAQRALPPPRSAVSIVPAHFGDEAGMIGAALLALGQEPRGVTGRLVVCPTPIGNLEDITLRVLAALREADVVACEDTRRTRVLLDRYGVKAKLLSYHEHNEKARAAELVRRMRDGAVVALVSDAGMPLVSDPGYLLVRGCVAAGLPVEVLPGPSAAITALVASGLPADEWRFHGFLPRKKGELRRELSEPGGTLVAFESPRRVPATLVLLAEIDPARDVAVCRELTKVHEEVVRGTAEELAARYADAPPKGEIVLVIGPGEEGGPEGGEPAGLDALRRLVDAGAHPRRAASVVAELTGGSANTLYEALVADD